MQNTSRNNFVQGLWSGIAEMGLVRSLALLGVMALMGMTSVHAATVTWVGATTHDHHS